MVDAEPDADIKVVWLKKHRISLCSASDICILLDTATEIISHVIS